jgi:TonB-linked SusC/RagA family outer membrane protein
MMQINSISAKNSGFIGTVKIYWMVFLLTGLTSNLFSQVRTISGFISDATDGSPLLGVTIQVPGTTMGVISDIEGNYTFNVPSGTKSLVFSYVGYLTDTVSIRERQVIDVAMKLDVEELDEVVVIGYGTVRKSDLTGSVASVKSEDLIKSPSSNAIDALQGKVAGLSVLSSSGNPGDAPIVRLRGVTTLNNNNPIFVVDGVITDDVSFLNAVDIESVEVLKDASSTAIFGSRGSNGVIIISTKSGTSSEPQINISLEQGFESVAKRLEVMNRDEFTSYYNVIYPDRYENVEELPDINWQDLVFREHTPISNMNASVSGKGDRISYYISGGYFGQEGVIPKSSFERITGKINTVYQVRKRFELGLNLTVSHTNKQNPPGIIGMLYKAFPIDSPTDTNGNFTEVRGSNNPLAAIEYSNSTTSGLSSLGNLYAQLTFLNDFRLKSSFQFDAGANKGTSFVPEYFISAVQQSDQSSLSKSFSNRYQFIFEQTLSYDKEFNEMSRLNMVAGMSSQVRSSEYFNANIRELIREDPTFWYLDAGNPELMIAENNATQSSLVSYLFRANYAWRNKYLFTATYRLDGSSNFGRENRYGGFPSAAVGWNISREPFFPDAGFIDDMKLRVSYGLVGNEKIMASSQYETIGVSSGAVFGANEAFYPGVSFTAPGNPFLKWETMKQFNTGLEFKFFQRRLLGEIDYYHKVTEDILVFLRPSGWAGLGPYTYVTFNAATVLNRGMEVKVDYRERIGDVNFEVGALATTIHNEVLSLAEDIGADSVLNFTGAQTRVGEPIGYFFGYDIIGVFQDENQLEQYPRFSNQEVGDFIYRDVNGDGQLDLEDRTKLGNSIPRYIYGFNLSAEYHGLRLSMDFQGQHGNLIFNQKQQSRYSEHNYDKKFNNYWRGKNTTEEHPRPSQGGVNFNISEYFMEDGSFLRLRTVTLNYMLPSPWLSRLSFDRVNIYIRANNLFTWTKYSGYSPDIGASNAMQAIVDDGIYPITRVFSAGINTNF